MSTSGPKHFFLFTVILAWLGLFMYLWITILIARWPYMLVRWHYYFPGFIELPLAKAECAQPVQHAAKTDYRTGGKLIWMSDAGINEIKADAKEAYFFFSMAYVQVPKSDAPAVRERQLKAKKHLTAKEISEVDDRVASWVNANPGLALRKPY